MDLTLDLRGTACICAHPGIGAYSTRVYGARPQRPRVFVYANPSPSAVLQAVSLAKVLA